MLQSRPGESPQGRWRDGAATPGSEERLVLASEGWIGADCGQGGHVEHPTHLVPFALDEGAPLLG